MKFYYEGQLVRTSKKHHYTHAYIYRHEDGTFSCRGCSSSKQGIEKMMLNDWDYTTYRSYKSVQDGTYKPKNKWSNTLEYMKEQAIKYYGGVDEAVKHYENIISRFEIVELEEI